MGWRINNNSIINRIKKIYFNSTLATKIRFSYAIVLLPILLLFVFGINRLWHLGQKYDDLINSVETAGQFSLDFKKDFDYETYLLIVENKTIEESNLDQLLSEANRIVNELFAITDSEDNKSRLITTQKYLSNLETYKGRIEENLIEGNKYEKNLEIWENDVQIVTSLLRESVLQYIYYEIQDIQKSRGEYERINALVINVLIVSTLVIFLIIIFLSYYIPLSITKPIRELSKVTDQVARGDLSVRMEAGVGAEVGVLSESLNSMIDKINELLVQVTDEQIRLRNAEFELLQSQINPHFLYNTLDTIVWLAESGDMKKVVSMVESLSNFFRTSLNQGKELVTIEEELKHVRSYLEIQQVRYQDILEYDIDVPEELNGYLIPKITIQPLVENALYHGIKNKRGLGKITLSGQKLDDSFELLVNDNGIGMSAERLNQVRDRISNADDNADNGVFGLHNVNERIRLKFGDDFGISIDSTYMEGTTSCVRLPLETNA